MTNRVIPPYTEGVTALVLFPDHRPLIERPERPTPGAPRVSARTAHNAAPREGAAGLARYEKRYGQSGRNQNLFDLLPTVARRKAARVAPYPLTQKDPFGEWKNPYDWDLHDVLVELEHLPHDYDASIGYLIAGRPREAAPGQKFWRAARSKAHFLNALMLRGERSILAVHEEAGLKVYKGYEYFTSWGIRWGEPDTHVLLVDGNGTRHQARAREFDRATGTATLRLEGYALQVRARFDVRDRVYRVRHALHLDTETLLPYEAAAHLANLLPDTLARVLPPDVTSDRRRGLVRLSSLERVLPKALWNATLEEALTVANPCRCLFYDLHAGRCGADDTRRDLPLPGTAAYACDDHEAL